MKKEAVLRSWEMVKKHLGEKPMMTLLRGKKLYVAGANRELYSIQLVGRYVDVWNETRNYGICVHINSQGRMADKLPQGDQVVALYYIITQNPKKWEEIESEHAMGFNGNIRRQTANFNRMFEAMRDGIQEN